MNQQSLPQMSLPAVAEQLRFPEGGQALCTGWDEAMGSSMAETEATLNQGFIASQARAVQLTDEMIAALTQFAPRVSGDRAAFAFFHYCRHRIQHDATLVESWEEQWPPLDNVFGVDAGLFNVLVMLSRVPEMIDVFKRLGIPDAIFRDTVADLRRWMETDICFLRHQRWGITPWIARWLCKHWRGKLLQIGRLQYSRGTFPGNIRVFRHRATHAVVALSEGGVRFCGDGHAWGPCCGEHHDDWTSAWHEDDQAVSGNPISPTGYAQLRPLRLERGAWSEVLRPQDPILTIHIPVGGPLSFTACGESLKQALEVFPTYFPEASFKGVSTASWLLDARLDGLLAPDANIVRLQRELHLFPGIQGDNKQIIQRVFGWGVEDVAQAPRATSLQRVVGEYLDAGGHFHGGYCFMLKDDFAWGSQAYRSRSPLSLSGLGDEA